MVDVIMDGDELIEMTVRRSRLDQNFTIIIHPNDHFDMTILDRTSNFIFLTCAYSNT